MIHQRDGGQVGQTILMIELTLAPEAHPPLAENPSLRKRGTCLPSLSKRRVGDEFGRGFA